MQDHYQILGIPPSAGTDEVKKAFRRLALQYHPDKNTAPGAARHFALVREAYGILSDPSKRAAYNYQRYLADPLYAGKSQPQSAEAVFLAARKLAEKTAGLDPFRLDRDQLAFELSRLFSAHNLSLLADTEEATHIGRLLRYLTPALLYLPLPMVKEVLQTLAQPAQRHEIIARQLADLLQQSGRSYYWNRYKVYAALLVALLFCLLLFFSAKK